jgi:recombination protein RecA
MSLEKILEEVRKKFGEGALMLYGEVPTTPIESIPTGCPSLDKALGIGGLPKGRIVEVYGPESSGKTTLALHVMAECQKRGGQVAFIDTEHALDPIYASNLGVDMPKVLISQPGSGEQSLEILETLVKSEEVDLVVVDSVAALTTQAELDGEMSDTSVAGIARLMSKALRKLTGSISKNNCTVIFINQLRANIGGYGNSPTEVTTGGKALKFYASIRLDIRRIGALKSGEDIIGSQTRVKVVKNKLSAPHKQVDFDLIHGEGISKESDLLDIAIDKGVIEKKGAWFVFEGANFAQGREKARKFLKNPEFYEKINRLVNMPEVKAATAD